VQVARARLHQWTPRVEARFLALLEQSCNVRLALRAVGLSAQSLHEHRKRWPAFDAACEEALARGYWNLDTGLAHAACALFLLGMILFCGSLYIRGLTGFHPIVLLTPFGGAALMLGWLALAASAWPPRRSAA
jgi:uncharacterized membrane protein YgdD (TMEM256/DUF423 family)